jgi:hypothetical protein
VQAAEEEEAAVAAATAAAAHGVVTTIIPGTQEHLHEHQQEVAGEKQPLTVVTNMPPLLSTGTIENDYDQSIDVIGTALVEIAQMGMAVRCPCFKSLTVPAYVQRILLTYVVSRRRPLSYY